MRHLLILGLVLQMFFAGTSEAARKYKMATVADPYMEMHTGPGRGYPIYYVVERDDSVAIIKRRTDWFLVRTERGKEGWVHVNQMTQTLQANGEQLEIYDMNLDNFSKRRWELGAMGGVFDGADLISVYGARAFSKN
ncbi:MAG: SH3 domain-containing protein, partial [Pseudomonadota bacterium]